MGHNAADAHAFIGRIGDAILPHLRHPHRAIDRQDLPGLVPLLDASVVQCDHLPLIVQHGRTRRARIGVGGVVEVGVEEIDDLVVAQRDFLRRAFRVLDDGDVLLEQNLALLLNERQKPVVAQTRLAVGSRAAQRDKREVKIVVRVEEAVGFHAENHRRARGVGLIVFVVEVDQAAVGIFGRGQDVVVGQQQMARDEEAGSPILHPAAPVAHLDAADGAGRAAADF